MFVYKQRRPRIGIVVPSFLTGGGVPAVARFLLAVAKSDDQYVADIISLSTSADDPLSTRLRAATSWRGGPKVREETWNGYRLFHVGAAWAEFEFQRYKRRSVLSELVQPYDVLQVVCGSGAWAGPVIGLGKPVSLQLATRVKVERRRRDSRALRPLSVWRKEMTRVTHKVEERALRSVDAIQVENPWMLEDVRNLNADRPGVNIQFAPPGVDVEEFRPLGERCLSDEKYILTVGRLNDPRKNVDLLLEAFHRIASQHPTVNLVTAGLTPPPESFWVSVRDRGLTKRVRHVAKPSAQELVDLYQRACVFVLSSDEEGLGIVLLEAMACGVPVVATRCGGPDGFVSDGENGCLVGLRDSAAMAERLGRLLEDPNLNRRMGVAARRTIERRFSQEVTGRAFVNVWDRLLAHTSC
jgi:glycosyltransferase involved in cell wall biosynthesis